VDLTGQWADTLFSAERVHLLKLGVWSLLSVLTGTAVLAVLRSRSMASPLLRHFAIQTLAWGAAAALVVLWGRSSLVLRDFAGAVALDRALWFRIGLEAGVVGIGVALSLTAWSLGRRLGVVGAGLGIAVQGTALALLDLQLAAHLIR
jgi:hypothetical protein